jgi:glutaredoxin
MARASVTLYTRTGCCLCDDVKKAIADATKRAEFEYRELDIDADPVLRQRYNDEVPVVEIDGKKAFKYRMTVDEFLKKLAARQ